MELKNIIPWGRTLHEYREMFLLTEKDLQQNILGCGDGPASFNVELRALGGNVISIDPTYTFSKKQLQERIDEVADEIIDQVRKTQKNFVWKNIKDIDDLYRIRMSAMHNFLGDYEIGKKRGYYQAQMLPELIFEDKKFDLALSSHFLFLYSYPLDFVFHLKAILEMLRVAKEVRIFPLLTLKNEYSSHLDGIVKVLEDIGYSTEIIKTDYEFQKGGDEMLKIKTLY